MRSARGVLCARVTVRAARRASTSSPFVSSAGAAPLTYFSAWFCPFAHRTTIALEHHATPYEWVEALGWEQRPPSGDENFAATERDAWWYHWKHPKLLEVNPAGMVPTLLDPVEGHVASESIVCIELVDALAAQRGAVTAPLVPTCPWKASHARAWAARVDKTVTAEYYNVLVRTDEGERTAAFERLVLALGRFTEASEGPFFSGETLGLVDATLLPYAFRLYALEHYRGAQFAVPRDLPWSRQYHEWLARCVALPCVAKTLPDKQRYLAHVAKYANNAARSKVGNAVRRGANAHSYDDDLDGDAA